MKTGYRKTTAVILNTFDYAESDRVVTFYTLDFGKLKGIAKGARRSKKRFVGNLDPPSYVRVAFFESPRGKFVRIADVNLIDGFPSVKTALHRYANACYMLELTSEMTKEGEPNEALFETLVGFMKLLSSHDASSKALRFFEIKLLKAAGYLPSLDECSACKREPQEAGIFFSLEKGAIVCQGCRGFIKELIPMSFGAARLMSMAARLGMEKLDRLRPTEASLDEAARFLSSFIRYQLGKELKTRRFIA